MKLQVMSPIDCTCHRQPRPCAQCHAMITSAPHYYAEENSGVAYCWECGEGLRTMEALK